MQQACRGFVGLVCEAKSRRDIYDCKWRGRVGGCGVCGGRGRVEWWWWWWGGWGRVVMGGMGWGGLEGRRGAGVQGWRGKRVNG